MSHTSGCLVWFLITGHSTFYGSVEWSSSSAHWFIVIVVRSSLVMKVNWKWINAEWCTDREKRRPLCPFQYNVLFLWTMAIQLWLTYHGCKVKPSTDSDVRAGEQETTLHCIFHCIIITICTVTVVLWKNNQCSHWILWQKPRCWDGWATSYICKLNQSSHVNNANDFRHVAQKQMHMDVSARWQRLAKSHSLKHCGPVFLNQRTVTHNPNPEKQVTKWSVCLLMCGWILVD